MTGRAIGSRLAIAQARAEAARSRLLRTIGRLQERARPTSLVHDIRDTLKERGADVVAGLVDTAKTRPARTGAVLALAGLLVARRQVWGLIRRTTTSISQKKGPTA